MLNDSSEKSNMSGNVPAKFFGLAVAALLRRLVPVVIAALLIGSEDPVRACKATIFVRLRGHLRRSGGGESDLDAARG
jgi:hypothetical protein